MNYRVVFSLAELDSGIIESNVIVALFSSGQVAAQAPAPVTLVKAGRLRDPRTVNVHSPAAVLIEASIGNASAKQFMRRKQICAVGGLSRRLSTRINARQRAVNARAWLDSA
jgi:hypothetical protein